MDFKRNLFWIVLGAVLVLGIGGYCMLISGIKSPEGKDTESLKQDATAKAEAIALLAKQADAPDAIKNPEHVKLASDFKARLEGQLKTMQDVWKTRKFDVRFADAPSDSSTKFDTWLGELRTRLTDQATKAGLQLPADADKLMFKEPTTDENSADVTRHRDFRLQQMAVVEEVISVLCRKYGKQTVLKFEADKERQEAQETIETGVVALERISISPPRSSLSSKATSAAASNTVIASEDRLKAWSEDAIRRSGRAQGNAKPTMPELPYTITSIDVQFVAPLTNVPGVVQALESDARFNSAVVTRVDYQRAVASPYPALGEAKLAVAGPVPMMNTHYQEAPVRALVSLDIYEYSAAKENALKAKAEEKPADDGKKKKSAK